MNSIIQTFTRLVKFQPDVPLKLRLKNKRVYWTERLRGNPLPPTTMMFLVQGNHEANYFVEGGRKAFDTVWETLEKSHVNHPFHTILDFGCGCGRVLRHWKSRAAQFQLYGVDYNPELVMWCRRVTPFARIDQNRLEPPLHYPDDMFDLIYAFSTFTHWDVALQMAWMREFRRILRPGGYIFFTTHGDYYLPALPPDAQTAFLNGQPLGGPSPDPNEVGTNRYASFSPFQYVRDELLQDFELVESYRRASRGTPWQDVYLARKS
ncbi:MAG: class I SAM-dependent methyltransferase [Chloroflexia bacterium]|nr:class I SAM-dependent methyltransferase [Chloroflexia bacterium]